MWTISNILTVGRIVLLLPLMGGFFLEPLFGAPITWALFMLYALGAMTDFFDGWLARKLNQITPFGTFLDPISDKIFVCGLLVLLVGFGRLEGLWMIPVIVILSRELLISGLREFLGPADVKMPVTKLAKWKTTAQMLALGFLILGPVLPYTLLIGQLGLTLAAILTIITGWSYLKVGMDFIKKMA